MELGLRGKPYYCRDWAFDKLRACLDKRPTSATCGTLVMGDSGCGKTAFCSQLVWPNEAKRLQVIVYNCPGYVFFVSIFFLGLSAKHF